MTGSRVALCSIGQLRIGEAMTSLFWKLPKNTDELIESFKWAAGGALSLEVKAPGTVTTNLLKQRNSGALQIRLDNYNVAGNPRL